MNGYEWTSRPGDNLMVSPPIEVGDGHAIILGMPDWVRCPAEVAACLPGLSAGHKLYIEQIGHTQMLRCPICGDEGSKEALRFQSMPSLVVLTCPECQHYVWLMAEPEPRAEPRPDPERKEE